MSDFLSKHVWTCICSGKLKRCICGCAGCRKNKKCKNTVPVFGTRCADCRV